MRKLQKYNNLHDQSYNSKLPRMCQYFKIWSDGSKNKNRRSTKHDSVWIDKKAAKLHKYLISSKWKNVTLIISIANKKLWRIDLTFKENK